MITFIIIVLTALTAFFLLYRYENNRTKADDSISTPNVSTSINSSTKRSNGHFNADGTIDVEYMKSMVTRWANDYAKIIECLVRELLNMNYTCFADG